MLCIQGADVATDWLLREEGNSLCKGNGWHLPAEPQTVLEKPFPPELTSGFARSLMHASIVGTSGKVLNTQVTDTLGKLLREGPAALM